MNDEGFDMMGRVLKLQRQLETGTGIDATAPLPAWTVDDMLNLEPPTWVIDGVLQAGTRFLLFAPSGHHKTNLAVDAACHIAHARDWHGRAVAGHPVVIVATEDAHGTAHRVVGWHDCYDMPSGRMLVVPGGELRLNDPVSVARLRATATKHFPGERVGYVIDHYDVSVDGDPTATGDAVESAAGLRELGTGAAFVLLLAHAPWTTDERAKVPVALWANVDARGKCERDPATGNATLTVLHQKNGISGQVLRFEFERHLFRTRKGEADCLIAKPQEGGADTPPKRPDVKLGDNEKIVLDCLGTALADHACEVPPARDVARGTRGVRVDEWEAAAVRYLPQREDWRKRQTFERAVKSLVRRRLVRHVDGWCWLPRAAHA
jgi:hypothetical protein